MNFHRVRCGGEEGTMSVAHVTRSGKQREIVGNYSTVSRPN